MQLIQFRHSHYNEKARWALDFKGLAHSRRSVLPGFHVPVVRWVSGQTATPVLVADDGTAIAGSAAILAWLETRYPDPPLLPANAKARAQVLAIQAQFDDDWMRRVRRPALDALLREPRDFADFFGDGRSLLARRAYAAMVPVLAPLVRRANGIGGAATDDGLRAIDEVLALVAERSGGTGYLVGDSFTLADLTAAATLAPLVSPPNSPMAAPRVLGRPFRALMAHCADHPGAEWVRRMYARHRHATHDFDGPSPVVPRVAVG